MVMDMKKQQLPSKAGLQQRPRKNSQEDVDNNNDDGEVEPPLNFTTLTLMQLLHMERTRKVSITNIFGARMSKQTKRDPFHRAVYPILLTAQLFALLPVAGIGAPSPTALRFKWAHLRTIYCLAFSVTGLFAAGIELHRMSGQQFDPKNFGGCILIFKFFFFMKNH